MVFYHYPTENASQFQRKHKKYEFCRKQKQLYIKPRAEMEISAEKPADMLEDASHFQKRILNFSVSIRIFTDSGC